MKNGKLQAIDLFSGAGGLSQGLKQAEFQVIGAVEFVENFAKSYELNHPKTKMYNVDIRELDPIMLKKNLGLRKGQLDLLAGCPPCQGFSTIGTRNKGNKNDPRNELVFQITRFVEVLMPKTIMMENVPALIKDIRMNKLVKDLETLGYIIDKKVLNTADFGMPQSRRRMILLASRKKGLSIDSQNQNLEDVVTVRNAIGNLEKAEESKDWLHNSLVNYKEKTIKIIKAIPKNGGSRTDLPIELQLNCHKKITGFKDVYGRMNWDRPSPTITGGCTSASKGRFIHPEEDRAITLREAALLQSFPRDYKFYSSSSKQEIATMIGNALPPKFIEYHAKGIVKHIKK